MSAGTSLRRLSLSSHRHRAPNETSSGRRTATALTALLIGGCIGSQSTAAFPLDAALAPGMSPLMVQQVGCDCDWQRCRLRPNQKVVRIVGVAPPSAKEFLSWVTPYLNCCNASSVPHYGYTYGPDLSLLYGFPAAPVARFAIRR